MIRFQAAGPAGINHFFRRVFKLPDISRPRIGCKVVKYGRHDMGYANSLPCADFIHQVGEQGVDVIRTLAQRGDLDTDDVDAIVEIRPEIAFFHLLLEIFVRGHTTTRTSTGMVWSPPTRVIFFSWRTRKRIACWSRGMSPISSRKSVPPAAISNFPGRPPFLAPVNAPSAYPNSSLEISSLGSAAQFKAMNGPLRLGLWLWTAWANNSLPVPLSPRIRMLDVPIAACLAASMVVLITGLCPMMSEKWKLAWALLNRLISFLILVMGLKKMTVPLGRVPAVPKGAGRNQAVQPGIVNIKHELLVGKDLPSFHHIKKQRPVLEYTLQGAALDFCAENGFARRVDLADNPVFIGNHGTIGHGLKNTVEP